MAFARLVGCALALAPAHAPEGSIRWDAPAQCPTAETVAARARALGARDRPVEVRITAVPGGFAAEVALDAGRRTLRSASCDELATAVALLVAAGLDGPDAPEPDAPEPDASPGAPEDSGAAVVPPPLEGAPIAATPEPSRDRPTPAPARSPRRPSPERPAILGPTLGVFGTAGIGLLPRVDAGGGLALGWTWRRVGVEVGGWALAPNARALGNGVRGSILLGAAAVAVCGRIRRAWFELRPCGSFEAGATRVRTTGAEVEPGARNTWLGLRGAVRALAWVHPRVAPVLSVGAVVPMFRTDYRVGDDVLISTAPVAFSATLGIELALGRQPSE